MMRPKLCEFGSSLPVNGLPKINFLHRHSYKGIYRLAAHRNGSGEISTWFDNPNAAQLRFARKLDPRGLTSRKDRNSFCGSSG